MRSGKKDKTTRGSTRSQKELDTLTIDREDKNNNDDDRLIQNCTSCHYCVRIIMAEDTLLCACTNGQRELEARFFDFKWWVLCQDDARCWTSDSKKREKPLEPEMPIPGTETIVGSLRDEIIASASKREALQTLEKYRRDIPITEKKKPKKSGVPKKVTAERSCHNCYFCVTERTISGASWCHCSNPARSVDVSPGKPWVESRLDLPCWKSRQE